jgi:hypothetical protein
LKNSDVWNLREWGVEQNAYLKGLLPKDILETEMAYAGGHNDRSYFALYIAGQGEKIDPKLVADRLLAEGQFYTLSEGLPSRLTDYMPVKTASK